MVLTFVERIVARMPASSKRSTLREVDDALHGIGPWGPIGTVCVHIAATGDPSAMCGAVAMLLVSMVIPTAATQVGEKLQGVARELWSASLRDAQSAADEDSSSSSAEAAAPVAVESVSPSSALAESSAASASSVASPASEEESALSASSVASPASEVASQAPEESSPALASSVASPSSALSTRAVSKLAIALGVMDQGAHSVTVWLREGRSSMLREQSDSESSDDSDDADDTHRPPPTRGPGRSSQERFAQLGPGVPPEELLRQMMAGQDPDAVRGLVEGFLRAGGHHPHHHDSDDDDDDNDDDDDDNGGDGSTDADEDDMGADEDDMEGPPRAAAAPRSARRRWRALPMAVRREICRDRVECVRQRRVSQRRISHSSVNLASLLVELTMDDTWLEHRRRLIQRAVSDGSAMAELVGSATSSRAVDLPWLTLVPIGDDKDDRSRAAAELSLIAHRFWVARTVLVARLARLLWWLRPELPRPSAVVVPPGIASTGLLEQPLVVGLSMGDPCPGAASRHAQLAMLSASHLPTGERRYDMMPDAAVLIPVGPRAGLGRTLLGLLQCCDRGSHYQMQALTSLESYSRGLSSTGRTWLARAGLLRYLVRELLVLSSTDAAAPRISEADGAGHAPDDGEAASQQLTSQALFDALGELLRMSPLTMMLLSSELVCTAAVLHRLVLYAMARPVDGGMFLRTVFLTWYWLDISLSSEEEREALSTMRLLRIVDQHRSLIVARLMAAIPTPHHLNRENLCVLNAACLVLLPSCADESPRWGVERARSILRDVARLPIPNRTFPAPGFRPDGQWGADCSVRDIQTCTPVDRPDPTVQQAFGSLLPMWQRYYVVRVTERPSLASTTGWSYSEWDRRIATLRSLCRECA